MVPEGHFHMRPFQWHLQDHWRCLQSLDTRLPWSEIISVHLKWWQNPVNVLKDSDFRPKDHNIQIKRRLGTHLEQDSVKGMWSVREKGYTKMF